MAQESFSINPHYLKHLRQKAGLSTQELADASCVTVRQYQRMECCGKTTRQKAVALAKKLKINIEELQNSQPTDQSPWYVQDMHELFGKLTPGYEEAIKHLCKTANVGNGKLNASGHVLLEIFDKQLPFYLKISIWQNSDDEYIKEWIIRPAIINESGIIWTPLNQWQRINWENQLRELKYSVASKVIINGEPLVPDSHLVGLIVHFEYLVDKQWSEQGAQFFTHDADFRSALSARMEANPRSDLFTAVPYTVPGTLMILIGTSERLRITRAWLDESGRPQQAPWPALQREQLSKAINEWPSNRAPLPIAVGEFGSEYFPELTPTSETKHQDVSKD